MHAVRIVARVVGPCLHGLHAKRAAACQRAVVSVVLGGALSLSGIALGMRSATGYRHRVKSVDRLLSNGALHAVRTELYAAVAARWLTGVRQLLLVVDWSDLSPDQRWHWLRASVAVEGRSVTLYEEVHPQHRLGNPGVHRRFLARVAELLPPGCEPIVMTDAGFRSTWFQLVGAYGWNWIGRIRHRDLVQQADGPWQRATALYRRASATACDLGRFTYVRSNPIGARLVLIKQAAKGRHRLNIYGDPMRAHDSAEHARREREPWLLASSPGLAHLAAEAIVKLYAQRMRIEQSFRDTKNARLGMGLACSRSRSRIRLEMLLVLAHLAAFVLRLIGESARQQQLDLQFQSTNRRARLEISVMTLARRVLEAGSLWLKPLQPWAAIPPLTQQARHACSLT